MTKVWGFSEPVGPLQFGLSGYRDGAIKLLKPGDLVVLVGTLDEPTPEDEWGKLVGMMEPTTEPVSSLDFLEPRAPSDFNAEGEYKWPFGLLNRAAWRFSEPRRLFSDFSGRRFNMDSAQGIVPLLPDEAAAILALPRTPSPLLSSFRTTLRLEGEDAARRRAAPPPTTTRTGVMHMRRAPASTYLLELERGRERELGFKVGWAFDWKARRRGFIQAAMPSIGGLNYRGRRHHIWPTAMDAFRMEQALLRQFDSARHPQNREVLTGVTFDELDDAWSAYVRRHGA
jgi:hypothetical protein